MTSTEIDAATFISSARLRAPQLPVGLARTTPARPVRARGQSGVARLCPARLRQDDARVAVGRAAGARAESVGWLSIDEHDNQPFQFWTAVIAALAVTEAAGSSPAFARLRPPQRALEPRFLRPARRGDRRHSGAALAGARRRATADRPAGDGRAEPVPHPPAGRLRRDPDLSVGPGTRTASPAPHR